MAPKPDYGAVVATSFLGSLFKVLVPLLIFLGLIAAIVLFLKKRGFNIGSTGNNTPYFQKKPLTETEQALYHRLIEALPDCVILAQVQLSSIIDINRIKAGKDFYRWFNPIAQQSVDFLVCLKDFTIVSAIELDDKSHWGKKAGDRDAKKDGSLKAAGIALIRWHAEAIPTVEKIRQAFHAGESQPRQKLQTPANSSPSGLNHFGKLIAACFGDRMKADNLLAYEFEMAPAINNDEAARRAIERMQHVSGL